VSLSPCIYWMLANVAIGEGAAVKRCANPQCGAFFVANNSKAKYCQGAPGIVSACMNRHKVSKPKAAKRSAVKSKTRRLKTLKTI
jgi:hypothetical protein